MSADSTGLSPDSLVNEALCGLEGNYDRGPADHVMSWSIRDHRVQVDEKGDNTTLKYRKDKSDRISMNRPHPKITDDLFATLLG